MNHLSRKADTQEPYGLFAFPRNGTSTYSHAERDVLLGIACQTTLLEVKHIRCTQGCQRLGLNKSM